MSWIKSPVDTKNAGESSHHLETVKIKHVETVEIKHGIK